MEDKLRGLLSRYSSLELILVVKELRWVLKVHSVAGSHHFFLLNCWTHGVQDVLVIGRVLRVALDAHRAWVLIELSVLHDEVVLLRGVSLRALKYRRLLAKDWQPDSV